MWQGRNGRAAPTPFRQKVASQIVEDETFLSSSRPKSLSESLAPKSGKSSIEPIEATAHRPTPFSNSGQLPKEELNGTFLPTGHIIDGRYEIVGKIAAGGMGEVYRANHVELGKAMAVKVMLPELSRDPEFVGRFKREAIAAGRIGQQNIVDISDFGQTKDGRFYFVMEYLDGLTLASTVHRQGAMKIERAVNVSVQVARALAAAHAQSIVHRDLKPENIMLLQRPGQADFVKVLDFGVAKVTGGKGQGGHTAIGMVVGTPQYMSPEQAKAIVVDARSDIYSLGLIMYELLTGRPTFTGETPSILMVKHVTEAPPAFHPGPLQELPEDLESLIFQMLKKEPPGRPQTMDEVVSRLDTLWAQIKSNTLPPRSTGEFQRPTGADERGTGVRVSGGFRSVNPSQNISSDALASVQKSKTPLIVGAFAGLVLASLGLWMLTLKKPTSIETPPAVIARVEPAKTPDVPVKPPVERVIPPVAAAKVKLTVTTEPDKAEVSEDDVLLGRTPLSLSRDSGAVAVLKFSLKGYKVMVKKIGFVSEQPIEIILEKEKPFAVPKKPTGKDLTDNPYQQKNEELKNSPF
jgi:eukaryotic-like serine/threonine-protein kinase